ncbi:MAG: methyltransferase domain-containing protein [Alphaproteobacteria bacterium]|nr:methyltransferase domain-containing protein [Alphaproteobacteria bacterium]
MSDKDYVLGTNDAEVDRLGLQHRVWREKALAAWRRAGIGPGMTVLDVGAGPGFAAADLAEIVGPEGRVVALERSGRFLAALRDRAGRLGLDNIVVREQDVCALPIQEPADAAWCRWVLSFAADPARVVAHIAGALRPGGVAVFHEYADYGSWRMMPPDPLVDRFRELVMRSWRESGGEPDIALRLPRLLAAAGLDLVATRPLIDIVGPADVTWRWPAAFMASNAARLAELGYLGAEEAGAMAGALEAVSPDTLMITPLVAEIVARKREEPSR